MVDLKIRIWYFTYYISLKIEHSSQWEIAIIYNNVKEDSCRKIMFFHYWTWRNVTWFENPIRDSGVYVGSNDRLMENTQTSQPLAQVSIFFVIFFTFCFFQTYLYCHFLFLYNFTFYCAWFTVNATAIQITPTFLLKLIFSFSYRHYSSARHIWDYWTEKQTNK